MSARVQDDDPRISAILAKPYGRVVYPECDGSVFAAILEFPGCFVAHTTVAKALSHLERVARAWLAAELERGNPIPAPLELTDVQRRLGLFPRYTREAG